MGDLLEVVTRKLGEDFSLELSIDNRLQATRSNKVAYAALVFFIWIYFYRPENVFPILGIVPIEKIAGAIVLIGLFSGAKSKLKLSTWPKELKWLLALLIWQTIGVVFASYIKGSLSDVINKSSKVFLVAIMVGLLVDSVPQLRRLMYIQATGLAFGTFLSVMLYKGDRLTGVLGGCFENPNDLAVNIALNWPICLMFLLLEKRLILKVVWFVALVVMIRGLMLTYSRSGFLALVIAAAFSLWEFGIRNKRYHLLVATALCGIALLVFGPQSYMDRIKSIYSNDVSVYGDAKEARAELLVTSLKITATHPLFGVGTGQFPAYSGLWRVTHNTYTELSSENGIPAIIFFLLAIRECFRNLTKTRKTALHAADPNVSMYTSALWAGFMGYLSGAAFASTASQLFPYILIGYTTALLRLANLSQANDMAPMKTHKADRLLALTGLPGWALPGRRREEHIVTQAQG